MARRLRWLKHHTELRRGRATTGHPAITIGSEEHGLGAAESGGALRIRQTVGWRPVGNREETETASTLAGGSTGTTSTIEQSGLGGTAPGS
jgi:hypothetical protein